MFLDEFDHIIKISIHALREEGDADVVKQRVDFLISIHALREEGDTINQLRQAFQVQFLSTPSARRATATSSTATTARSNFYPRPPRGGRHAQQRAAAITVADFYPRPPRGGRRRPRQGTAQRIRISIHALREEGDQGRRRRDHGDSDFYPRPPRGGRPAVILLLGCLCLFLSTPSARRATRDGIRTPGDVAAISIHALREEGDGTYKSGTGSPGVFLSTPSARRATSARIPFMVSMAISIHALREEGDSSR